MPWKISTITLVIVFSNFVLDAGAIAMAADQKSPLVIGHRGASGYRPEHTLASYELAIEMGADYIEPDLVMTKDKVLVARHENEISGTTDAALKFPDKKTTKTVDGEKITGWFIEDLTLAELKTLRANERLKFRDHSYDGKFEVPTFAEILSFVKKKSQELKKEIGVYPETKHPTYFKSIGLPLEEALVAELKKSGMNKKNSKVFIQSFEMSNLKELKKLTPLPLVFLIGGADEVPYDHIANGDKRTYSDLIKPASLKELSMTIAGIGPNKRLIIPAGTQRNLGPPTNLIQDAHAAGLVVHPYTFRNDKEYLHQDYQGDAQKEYLEFYKLGVDGLFSDFTDEAVKARKTFINDLAKDKKNEKN